METRGDHVRTDQDVPVRRWRSAPFVPGMQRHAARCVKLQYDDNTSPAPMIEQRAWVRMPSGKRLDLLDPTPFDWDDADLALGLARTYRWGGHSAWPLL